MITKMIKSDGARAARAALLRWAVGGRVLHAQRQSDAEPTEQACAKCNWRKDERRGGGQGEEPRRSSRASLGPEEGAPRWIECLEEGIEMERLECLGSVVLPPVLPGANIPRVGKRRLRGLHRAVEECEPTRTVEAGLIEAAYAVLNLCEGRERNERAKNPPRGKYVRRLMLEATNQL